MLGLEGGPCQQVRSLRSVTIYKQGDQEKSWEKIGGNLHTFKISVCLLLSGSITLGGGANLLIEYCSCEKVYFAQICKTP